MGASESLFGPCSKASEQVPARQTTRMADLPKNHSYEIQNTEPGMTKTTTMGLLVWKTDEKTDDRANAEWGEAKSIETRIVVREHGKCMKNLKFKSVWRGRLSSRIPRE